MKTAVSRSGWVLAAVTSLIAIAALAGVVRGGPLDPPGTPSSTLPQVEPRVPIRSLPFTITQPGSYFVVNNMTAATGTGITVNASNVTVDLDGFTVSGNATYFGVLLSGGYDHLTVRNGTLSSWGVGVDSDGANLRLEDLQIRGAINAVHAMGAAAVIDNVSADGVTHQGFWVGDRAMISNCALDAAGGNLYTGIIAGIEAVVTHCRTSGFGIGIDVSDHSQVKHCTVRGGTEGLAIGPAASVEGCLISGASFIGISAQVSSRIVDNFIDNPGSTGILLSGAFARVEGNQLILGDNKNGVSFNPGANENTVIGNRIRVGLNTSAIFLNGTTNDIGPIQSAAVGASPNANIVY